MTQHSNTTPYATSSDVAAAYRIDPRSVRRWVTAGCPAVMTHPVLVLDMAAVRAWVTVHRPERAHDHGTIESVPTVPEVLPTDRSLDESLDGRTEPNTPT